MARDLRPVYTAVNEADAAARLDEFHTIWGNRYPAIRTLWTNAWSEFVPFLDYAPEIRRVIYSTNAIESLNARIRRATRARGHFPNEQAAIKCLYLVVRSLDPNGTRPGTLDEPLEARPQRLRHHLPQKFRQVPNRGPGCGASRCCG